MRSKFLKLALISALLLLLGYYALPWCFTLPAGVMTPPAESELRSREGAFLGYVRDTHHYRQQALPAGEIPQNIQRALLAAEDRRFFSHGGVDALAMGRALRDALLAGGVKSGASTISMQLAKITLPQGERTLSRKLYEIMLARQLEMRYSKEEILRAYLNRADFGQLCRGVETAARLYFDCHAADLSPAQAALLVAQLRSPTHYNPLASPERAKAARDRILRAMGEASSCTNGLGLKAPQDLHVPHLSQRAGQLSISLCLQVELSQIIGQELEKLRGKNVQQAAALIVDNHTGEVLASVASADWRDPRGGQLDGTSVKRSAGSTLKPFVYLMALEAGCNPSTIYADIPTSFASAAGIEAPHNYNNHYLGPVSMRVSLASSQNIPAMLALNESGGVKAFENKLRELGYNLPEGDYGLGLAIGNAHVNLKEQAAAFACLARGGSWLPLRFDVGDAEAEPKPIIAPEHAWQLSRMLSDENARVAGFGRAPALSFPFACAVKTGTSSNFRDNWCVGYTQDYTVAVWVGNFDNSSMKELSGLSGAGPIFNRAMNYLHAQGRASLQERPEGMLRVGNEWLTSEQIEALPPEPQRDEVGRILLPIEYRDWLAAQGRAVQAEYAIDPEETLERKAQIFTPSSGVTLRIDPSLAQEGRKLPLESSLHPARSRWSSHTLRLFQEHGKWYAWLEEGQHRIEVEDPQTGKRAESYFTVLPL